MNGEMSNILSGTKQTIDCLCGFRGGSWGVPHRQRVYAQVCVCWCTCRSEEWKAPHGKNAADIVWENDGHVTDWIKDVI